MGKKTITKDVTVLSEVDITLDLQDILDYVMDADDDELDEIKEAVESASLWNANVEGPAIKVETLYDVEKMEILQRAFAKYTLQELEEKLGRY